MVPLLTSFDSYQRACGRKRQYVSKYFADLARERMAVKMAPDPIDSYKRDFCKYFHIGHVPGWTRELLHA